MSETVWLQTVQDGCDAATVSRLAYRIWRQHYTPIIGADQVAYMLERFQSPQAIHSEVSQNRLVYQLLRSREGAVGYMAYHLDSEKGCLFLSKFYVDTTYRGRGFGRFMIEHLMSQARSAHLECIELTVNRHNHDSLVIYRKLGFHVVGEVVQDIGGGYVMDDYRLRLDWS